MSRRDREIEDLKIENYNLRLKNIEYSDLLNSLKKTESCKKCLVLQFDIERALETINDLSGQLSRI